MIDLAIVVEGQTEEAFVNLVLQPHLAAKNISAWAVLPGRGANRRGGRWAWASVSGDILSLLKQRSGRVVGVMFDYYGLPLDWPGRGAAAHKVIEQRAASVESALSHAISLSMPPGFDLGRFVPHIQLHEYEARLFSDCGVLAEVLGLPAEVLEGIVKSCGSPERIDDDPLHAPSKRLESLCAAHGRYYRKTTSGVTAAKQMGLDVVRAACPHFASWLSRLEALGSPPLEPLKNAPAAPE